jgi:hypothetical protein
VKVLLIDIDSKKIPELALMKLSAYHKAQGDKVYFNNLCHNPDKVYIACVFEENKSTALGVARMYPSSEVTVGGSGVDYNWLPSEIEFLKPDYDIYPSSFSQGFTTRGCIRRCKFCIVPEKEGPMRQWQHIRDFHDSRFDTVMLMDNNWYADRDWFFENTDYLIEHNLKVIEHGMDIRLLTEEIATRLKELRWGETLHFAWDFMRDEKRVLDGLEILKNAGFDMKHKVQVYVLVGFNTTPEQDIYRCQKLKSMGASAFVMPFRRTEHTNAIARWANRKWAFWSCDFNEYKAKS